MLPEYDIESDVPSHIKLSMIADEEDVRLLQDSPVFKGRCNHQHPSVKVFESFFDMRTEDTPLVSYVIYVRRMYQKQIRRIFPYDVCCTGHAEIISVWMHSLISLKKMHVLLYYLHNAIIGPGTSEGIYSGLLITLSPVIRNMVIYRRIECGHRPEDGSSGESLLLRFLEDVRRMEEITVPLPWGRVASWDELHIGEDSMMSGIEACHHRSMCGESHCRIYRRDLPHHGTTFEKPLIARHILIDFEVLSDHCVGRDYNNLSHSSTSRTFSSALSE